MKTQILKYILIILSLLLAFLAWRSVERAIKVENASVWGMPILWFSLFFIALALAIILVKSRYYMELLAFFSLAISLFFSLSVAHFISVTIAFLVISLAVGKIRKDLKLNVKVDMWKTLRSGSTYIILALGITVASQYYSTVRESTIENIIPKFKMEGLTNSLTNQVLSAVNPNFKNLDQDGLTVDQLILNTGRDQMVDNILGTGLDSNSMQLVQNSQNLILEQGRKQFSQIVGRELTGQEKFSEVISEIVNNKINQFIAPNFSGEKFPLLPLILSLVLFLTIIPLGSFLSPIWIMLANLIFKILVKSKLIIINKIPAEVEVIE
ncbi:MAG: hypothetical protein NTZ97_04190 [Candidatus Moranbacteria bacterium]|nr:hypothetical protein [Candidatus Moranbacteria bacterium]